MPALGAPESRLGLAVFGGAVMALRTEFGRAPSRGLDVFRPVALARGLELGALLARGGVRKAPRELALDVDEFAVLLVRAPGGADELAHVHALAAHRLVALGKPDRPLAPVMASDGRSACL